MALKTAFVKDELGILKYFGSHFEVKERQGTGRIQREVTVGYRYKLLSYSGIGKEIIINIARTTPLTLPMGATVKLVNPVVRPKGVRNGQNSAIEAIEIWADNIVAV